MKLLFALLLLFHTPPREVLLCTGNSAYAYHYRSSCPGLRACRAQIIKVTLDEARADSRTPCQRCVGGSVVPVRASLGDAGDGQCSATTKKGARCSRSARSAGRCWQHGG